MDYLLALVFCFTVILNICTQVSSMVCTKEIRDDTTYITCPQQFIDSKDKQYCCGTKKNRYCCSSAEFSSAINTIGVIVGVLVSAIVVVVILVVISCFCCSCCLLARRRKRAGHVYGPASTTPMTATTTGTTTVVAYPTQPMAYPQQQTNYPQQAMAPYPSQNQPAYPSYPAQQYPPAQGGGYQGGYPPAGGVPPPYPIADPNQPAYNPGYGN